MVGGQGYELAGVVVMSATSRWWKEVQLYGWLVFIAYMLLDGRDESYLAPLQHKILLAGGGVLFLVLVASLTGKSTPNGIGFDWKGHLALAVESVGHWTPLIVVALMGVTTLNMNPEALRNGIQMRVLDPNRVEEDISSRLEYLRPGEYFETTHIQLYTHPDLASGVSVSLIGRISRLQGDKAREVLPARNKGEELVLLYRLAIACCAADASPLAVILEGISPEVAFSEKGWFRVQGVTRQPSDESRFIILQVEHFETISPPDKPYLSWLDLL